MSCDLDRRLMLTRHADLKHRLEEDVLVLPERAIRIGGSGGEILRLCNGVRSGREVIAAMQERYPDTPGIEAEVRAFLDEMLELGGLVSDDPGSSEAGSHASGARRARGARE